MVLYLSKKIFSKTFSNLPIGKIIFSQKNNLQILIDKNEEKIKFISIEKNIHLEVNKESVKGRWEKNNEQDAINIMIELYLKAIENKKIDRHLAKGADPEVI